MNMISLFPRGTKLVRLSIKWKQIGNVEKKNCYIRVITLLA